MFLTHYRTMPTLARSIAVLFSTFVVFGCYASAGAQVRATESQLSAKNINTSVDDRVSSTAGVPSKRQTRLNYKVGKSFHTVSGAGVLVVHVSVKPKEFNREDMLKLADQLRLDFTRDTRLSVWIFDSYSSAKTFTPLTHSRTYDRDYRSLRGFYDLKRDTGEEKIEFSTARGKPRDEIRIKIK